jgi:hypothetical protein
MSNAMQTSLGAGCLREQSQSITASNEGLSYQVVELWFFRGAVWPALHKGNT